MADNMKGVRSMDISKVNQYIRDVKLNKDKITSYDEYPFSLTAIKELDVLELHKAVTFIIGENGSGKSTLLEAIAVNYGFNPEGGTKNFKFSTNDTHSNLHKYIKLTKGIKIPETGYFLRAESFYNVASNIDELDSEGMGNRIINSYGGISLHEQSHGEAFFSIIMNRFSGRGLYILDEPEAALSPSRQLAMISRINELVKEGSQFIIATHSPILMSYPDSVLYEISDKIEEKCYTETYHFNITRSFLNNPEKYLRILLNE